MPRTKTSSRKKAPIPPPPPPPPPPAREDDAEADGEEMEMDEEPQEQTLVSGQNDHVRRMFDQMAAHSIVYEWGIEVQGSDMAELGVFHNWGKWRDEPEKVFLYFVREFLAYGAYLAHRHGKERGWFCRVRERDVDFSKREIARAMGFRPPVTCQYSILLGMYTRGNRPLSEIRAAISTEGANLK